MPSLRASASRRARSESREVGGAEELVAGTAGSLFVAEGSGGKLEETGMGPGLVGSMAGAAPVAPRSNSSIERVCACAER